MVNRCLCGTDPARLLACVSVASALYGLTSYHSPLPYAVGLGSMLGCDTVKHYILGLVTGILIAWLLGYVFFDSLECIMYPGTDYCVGCTDDCLDLEKGETIID